MSDLGDAEENESTTTTTTQHTTISLEDIKDLLNQPGALQQLLLQSTTANTNPTQDLLSRITSLEQQRGAMGTAPRTLSMERKVEQLKTTKKNGTTVIETQNVTRFCDALTNNLALRGANATYSADEHKSFLTKEAIALITLRHSQQQIDDDEETYNIYSLDSALFIARLRLLFPLLQDTESTAQRIRKFSMPKNWYKHKHGLEGWCAQIAVNLDFLDGDGNYKTENGDICTEEEFSTVREEVFKLILPDPNNSEANKNNANWKTNRLLVDKIKKYMPVDFHTLLLAISHVSKELAEKWDNANQLSWCYQNPTPTTEHKEDKHPPKHSGEKGPVSSNYKGNKPWPACDKCNTLHNPANDCTKKPNNTGGGSNSSSSNDTKKRTSTGSPGKGGKAPWLHKSGGDKRNKPNSGNNNDANLSMSNYTQNVIHKSITITQEVDLVNNIVQPLNTDLIISGDSTKRKFQTDQVNINITPSDTDLLHNLLVRSVLTDLVCPFTY